jgi:TonB family protein
MEFLSLNEPAPAPARRLSRAEGVLVSFGLHLLVFLLILFLPKSLPESVLALFRGRPSNPSEALAATADEPNPRRPLDRPKIPLKFAYVKVPNDTASPRNETAPLLSDKNRRARQEVPTPPDLKRFSIDPHSRGDSIDRVRPDPSVPEGPETPEPARKPVEAAGTGRGGAPGGAARGPEGDAARGSTGSAGRAARPPGATGEGGSGQGGEGEGTGAGDADDAQEDLRRALEDLRAGEYKFHFDNPGYLRDGTYGTMQFDTQDFPWGAYARTIYVIIRNNWFARIPLAAREGIRGYVHWRFIIEKDGTISRIIPVHSSSIPPFDKAAADALQASSPLPPLPQGFPKEREGVVFGFYYNMFPGEAE